MIKFVVQISKERCKGCSLCVVACPQKLIQMTDTLNSQGYPYAEITRTENCTGCKQCADMCPDVAITILRKDKPASRKSTAVRTKAAPKKGR